MMNTAQQVNILSSEFKSNPFPLLSRLRAEHAVCRVTLPDKTPVWLVTRYEDVKTLLTDERFAKSRYNALTPEQLRKQPWIPPMLRPLDRTMLDLDPPGHTRLRLSRHA
jgi:cytochrome P450